MRRALRNLFSQSADALLLYNRQPRQRLQAQASRADFLRFTTVQKATASCIHQQLQAESTSSVRPHPADAVLLYCRQPLHSQRARRVC